AKPGFLPHLPAMILGRDRGSRVRLSGELLDWGLRFLGQCTRERARENTLAVLKLALRSATLLEELRQAVPLEFGHRRAGKLVLLSSDTEVEAARASSELKQQQGSSVRVIPLDEAIAVEPAIADMRDDIIAAVYSEQDEVADSRLFTTGLKHWLEDQGAARFRLSCEAKRLITHNGRACSVAVDGDDIEADAVVVCLGAGSQDFLKRAGVNPHILPVRGYSITLRPGPAAPDVSVTALRHKMVFSRLNGRMRIAGFADFHGFDTRSDDQRIHSLLDLARDFAPLAAQYDADDADRWGGFRPMTPSGQPLVGPTSIRGLYLNVGHGMLGWTLACATAQDVAQAVRKAH
ncbi:MAG: FAD-dependent oxidoreductase, partial [Woeseiaceae bacterium]